VTFNSESATKGGWTRLASNNRPPRYLDARADSRPRSVLNQYLFHRGRTVWYTSCSDWRCDASNQVVRRLCGKSQLAGWRYKKS